MVLVMKMKLKGENASSKKTIEAIKKAFAEMMEEKKEIRNITVTELTKKANITRGAFYSHYDNIYDVAQEFQDEILREVFKQEIIINSKEKMHAYVDDIFNYLEAHQNIYSQLLNSSDAIIFMNRLNKMIRTTITKTLKSNKSLDVIFFTDGTINLIIQYFRHEIKENLKEIGEYVKDIADYLFF